MIPGDNLDKIACDGSEPEGPQWDDVLTYATTFDQSGDVTVVVNPTGDDLDSDDSFMITDAEDSAPWGTADEHGGDISSFTVSGDGDQDSALSDTNDTGFDTTRSDGGVNEDGVNTFTAFSDGDDSTSMLGSDA